MARVSIVNYLRQEINTDLEGCMSSPDAIQCAGLYAILCRFAAGLYVKEN
jgi:hypothetical protein